MTSVARVRGIDMAYDESGPPDAPAVVLLHGFPFNRTLWREQTAALSATHRVITPDLRCHGETSVTPGAATMEDMAADVAALLDELRVERCVLDGLSMGGYVALAFYRAFRERVSVLVLADTRTTPDTDEGRQTREETAQKVLREGMKPIADAMLPKLLAPATLNKRPEVVAHVREMILATKPEGAASALRGMAVRRDQRDLLREIDVPALVVVGSEDALTPVADSELLHREIKNSRLVVFAGAGHVSNLERSAEFDRTLVDFLSALPS